jgi:hypothetical protein
MSTQARPTDPQGVVMVPTLPAPRHAFGWPPGSIRAILVLIVVALTCTLMLITRDQRGRIIPVPPYLFYLLFFAVGYYFAVRGHSREVHRNAPPPLWLPAGSIRLIIMAAITATVIWKLVHDREGLLEQLRASALQIHEQPLLPLVILAGFFAGVLVRVVIIGKHERSPWAQDLEAWVALVGVLLMGIAAIIHLVINPTLEDQLQLPDYEGLLAGVVTFYFGLRA